MNKQTLYRKFRKSYTGLILMVIISIMAGFNLLIYPETVPMIIVQGLGLLCLLDGVSLCFDILIKFLKK